MKIENKILNFYRRVIFGTNYKKNKITKDDILNYCFDNAWVAMSAHTLHVKDKDGRKYKVDNDKHAKELKTSFKDVIQEKFFKSAGKTNKENIRDNIVKISETRQEDKNLNISLQLTIGQSQKLVNMFYKYLYSFKDIAWVRKLSFEDCDCPIDQINLIRIKEDFKNIENLDEQLKDFDKDLKTTSPVTYNGKCWGQIEDMTDYQTLQLAVDKIIQIQGHNKTRLDYDFDWE